MPDGRAHSSKGQGKVCVFPSQRDPEEGLHSNILRMRGISSLEERASQVNKSSWVLGGRLIVGFPLGLAAFGRWHNRRLTVDVR